jgi:membrane-associated phospholipid phosphatase
MKAPGTWVPAIGAAVIGLGGWDAAVSDWARENTPVFGTQERAAETSTDLRTASHIVMILSAVLVSATEKPWRARLERLAWEHAGAIVTTGITGGVKGATGRLRPDGSDDSSFPSGHTSRAFAYAAASDRNIDAMGAGRAATWTLRGGTWVLAAGTGWARVEAGAHFPTDVLVGAALGNFVATFVYEAFLRKQDRLRIAVEPEGDGFVVRLRWRF